VKELSAVFNYDIKTAFIKFYNLFCIKFADAFIHNNMKSIFFKTTSAIILLAICLWLNSCANDNKNTSTTIQVPDEQPASSQVQDNGPASQMPQVTSDNIEVKTFEVKDSAGTSQGWGYDIYVDSKKMIHQPIIPAIPGNNSFKTEQDAQKTGLLAANKMRKEGSLPTLSVKELEKLGVIKK
jgi:hypothetical protein